MILRKFLDFQYEIETESTVFQPIDKQVIFRKLQGTSTYFYDLKRILYLMYDIETGCSRKIDNFWLSLKTSNSFPNTPLSVVL